MDQKQRRHWYDSEEGKIFAENLFQKAGLKENPEIPPESGVYSNEVIARSFDKHMDFLVFMSSLGDMGDSVASKRSVISFIIDRMNNTDFSITNVGDKLVRVMVGFRDGDFWRNEAEVTELSETVIKCLVMVDVPRHMQFDRKTGINLNGKEYGWLESGTEQ